MQFHEKKNNKLKCAALLFTLISSAVAHSPIDFDDSIIYKIEFADLVGGPDVGSELHKFHTGDKEIYTCQIPPVISLDEEKNYKHELSPITLLQPIFSTPGCSYRIEAYWSYEICHGHHVRQYHEEREGKNVKFQEYYLGNWSDEKTELVKKQWEADRKSGIAPKYKTLKIDNTKYLYFEMEFTDGTMCDIVDAPRTTMVRYVCYPLGKDEIYSFKETSSCNYEAIILTSTLCSIPAFHAEESKEIPIKCFNELEKTHKPISMLKQELSDSMGNENDLLIDFWSNSKANQETVKVNWNLDTLITQLMDNDEVDGVTAIKELRDFISGKNCFTGGTGWWKYEFCYGKHVRQYHKDKNSETELFLGYFSEEAHKEWINTHPDKVGARANFGRSLWHHYGKGTHCDQTNLPREVDVKLTCAAVGASKMAVSMYLLEPKACQYILVVQSPIICNLVQYADEFDLVKSENLDKLIENWKLAQPAATTNEAEEPILS